MKSIIFAATLLSANFSFAGECQEYVTKRFADIQAKAVQMHPEHASTLASISPKMVGSRDFYGHADVHSFHIEFSSDICQLPQINQDKVMAHELGHIVAWLTYPSMKKEITSKIHVLSEQQHELIADTFGAKFLDNALNHEIVNTSEKKCNETQEKYFCDVSVNWLYATTH